MLSAVPGVVDHGLFIGIARTLIVAARRRRRHSRTESRYEPNTTTISSSLAAARAACAPAAWPRNGAKVAIAEEYGFGGTCVIRGCIPKKLFVYASHYAEDFEDAGGFGWTVPRPKFDWDVLVANKDKEIARLEGLYHQNVTKAGVEIIMERAEFAGPAHRSI